MNKLTWLSILLLSFVSNPSWALPEFVNQIGVNAGAGFGWGGVKNSENTLRARTTNSFHAHLMPGYKIGAFMPGVYGDLRLAGQERGPGDLEGNNVKGSGYLLGLGTTYDPPWENIKFLGNLLFLGQYNFSRKTSDLRDSSLRAPFGFTVMGQYSFFEVLYTRLAANLSFQWIQYSKSTLESPTGTINNSEIGSNKVRDWAVRLGVAFQY